VPKVAADPFPIPAYNFEKLKPASDEPLLVR
jgi:hypothetical protein